MQDQTQGNAQQLNLSVDLGGGKQVDVEFGTSDRLWISTGPGIGGSDVWMKAESRLVDLRVRIRRTPDGVEIAVDRGDTEDPWWPAGGAPRLGGRHGSCSRHGGSRRQRGHGGGVSGGHAR